VPNIVVICINFHNEEQTIAFVRRLVTLHSPSTCQVIVASNNVRGNGNEVLAEALADKLQVTIMHWSRNLGYFGAAALALDVYRSTHELPDWVVVSNTDLLVGTESFTDQLNQYQESKGIGIVAPSITATVTDVDQNPFMERRPTAIRMHIVKWMLKTWLTWTLWSAASRVKLAIRQRRRNRLGTACGNGQDSNARSIYAPHGSFIAFSREYFLRGGTLDHVPFLYGEEIMVAETARDLSLTVLYDPKIRLKHMEHSTTGKSTKIRKYQAASASYCADTYFPLRIRFSKEVAHGR